MVALSGRKVYLNGKKNYSGSDLSCVHVRRSHLSAHAHRFQSLGGQKKIF